MGTHFVKEGNAFYEIDDACMKRKEQAEEKRRREKTERKETENEKKTGSQSCKRRNK